MIVIYWRTRSNIVDIRKFKDYDEIMEWILRQTKLEDPVAIVGIHDKNEKMEVIEKEYQKFKACFERA